MKTKNINLLLIIGVIGFMCSCSISRQSVLVSSPNYHIEFYKADFEYSQPLVAEASSVRVFGIDWIKLFNWEKLNSNEKSDNPIVFGLSSEIPVLGEIARGKVSTYALYNLMTANPGYDLVIYPQYKNRKFIIPIFYSKRSVQVTARLAKIN